MNDLTTLHEVGEELDPAAAQPPERLRGRVLSGIAGQPRRRLGMLGRLGPLGQGRQGLLGGRVAVPRLGWRLAAAGGLAAALAAGLLVAQTVSIGDHSPAATAEAAEILHSAAQAVRQVPDLSARPDQFVYVESATAYSVTSGATGTTRIEPKQRRVWLSGDGTGDGLLRERRADDDEWSELSLPGCRDGRETPIMSEAKQAEAEPNGAAPTGCKPVPAYLGDLPTDVDAMYRYLYDNSQGDNPRDVQAFVTVGDLIRENYVRPQAMAAMFDAAARIPGVTVIRDVADAAGRHGVAVAQVWQGGRAELIFDATTYRYLGERTVAVKDGNGWHKGDVTGSAAQLRIAIVDRAGELPR